MQEMQVAINYFRENKINETKKIFEKIIKENYNQDVYFNYAYILGEIGEYKKEQKLYEEILKRNPDDFDGLINYAISLIETKNYKKAISITTNALSTRRKEKLFPSLTSNLLAIKKPFKSSVDDKGSNAQETESVLKK